MLRESTGLKVLLQMYIDVISLAGHLRCVSIDVIDDVSDVWSSVFVFWAFLSN